MVTGKITWTGTITGEPTVQRTEDTAHLEITYSNEEGSDDATVDVVVTNQRGEVVAQCRVPNNTIGMKMFYDAVKGLGVLAVAAKSNTANGGQFNIPTSTTAN